MSNSTKVLEIRELSKEFFLGKSNTLQVLKDISFTASKGEFISILGISGSGKSTLLKCVSSLLKPTKGQVLVKGIDPYKIGNVKLSNLRRNDISFIFQSYNLVPSLPVVENILLPLRLSHKKMDIEFIEKLLRRMNFNAGLTDFVGTLSGG